MQFRSVLAILIISQAYASHYYHAKVPKITNVTILAQKWELIEKDMQKSMSDLAKLIPPFSMDDSNQLNISGSCTTALFKFVRDFLALKRWAHQMFDATGKPEGGQMVGTVSSYGSYDECLELAVARKSPSTGSPLFVGQYCIADFRLPLPPRPKYSMHKGEEIPALSDNFKPKTEVMQDMVKMASSFYTGAIRFGLCIPSTCSKQDLKAILTNVAESKQLNVDLVSCEVKEEFKLTTLQIVIIAVFGVNIVLVLSGTLLHHYSPSNDSVVRKCLLAFSIQLNVGNLFAEGKDEPSLKFLNGMRFISMTWVVLGHCYLLTDYQSKRGTVKFFNLVDEYFAQAITNGFLSVDTFFFVTGLLLAYILVKQVDLKGKHIFNPFIMLIRRITRFWILVALAICTFLVLPLANSGPTWKSMADPNYNLCRDNWWMTAIFINNFFTLSQTCIPQGWYLATDMQLLILSFVYFFFLFKKPILGHVTNIIFAISSSASVMLTIYIYEIPPTILISNVDEAEGLLNTARIYYPFNVHLHVFAVGLTVGTYMARSNGLKLTIATQIVGWICAITSAIVAVYGVHPWNAGKEPSLLWSMLYAGFHKLLWAVGIAWMTLMCWSGRGGWINAILSWNGFVVLNRLSFLTYMLHVQVLAYVFYSFQGVQDADHRTFVYNFLGSLVVSLMFSVFFRIIYEGPLIEIDKMAFAKLLKAKVNKENKGEKEPKLDETIETSIQNSNTDNGDVSVNTKC